MMTGPEHYALAERLLARSEELALRNDYIGATLAANQAETHARLAEIATRLPAQRAADTIPA